jgi:hypothetical protein
LLNAKNPFFLNLNYLWRPFCCLDAATWGSYTICTTLKWRQHIPEAYVCPQLTGFEPMIDFHYSWYKYQPTAGLPASINLKFLWCTFKLEVTIASVTIGCWILFCSHIPQNMWICHSKFLVPYKTASKVNVQTCIYLQFVDRTWLTTGAR